MEPAFFWKAFRILFVFSDVKFQILCPVCRRKMKGLKIKTDFYLTLIVRVSACYLCSHLCSLYQTVCVSPTIERKSPVFCFAVGRKVTWLCIQWESGLNFTNSSLLFILLRSLFPVFEIYTSRSAENFQLSPFQLRIHFPELCWLINIFAFPASKFCYHLLSNCLHSCKFLAFFYLLIPIASFLVCSGSS